MRGPFQGLLYIVIALISAALITKAMYWWPDLFPAPLRALGNALINTTGVTSAEASSNIEAAYVFVVSLAFVVIAIAILRFLVVHTQRSGKASQQ